MRRFNLCFALLALAALGASAEGGPDLITAPEQSVSIAEPPARDVPVPEALRFVIREILFTKSEILSPEELDAVARDFNGRELGLVDLKLVAARVNELYRGKGVVTAQAVVPPQNISGGVGQIRLIEGRLGRIRVKGNAATDEGYVVEQLGMKPDDLVDLKKLRAALVRFNRTNDAQLRCELAPGERFATTDLIVLVSEPRLRDLRLIYDSLGSSSTGKERTGVSYGNRSLFGFRDDLSLAVTQATGQYSVTGTYAIPFTSWGTRLNLGYTMDRTAIKSGSLETLNITGEAFARTTVLRQPVFVNETKKIEIVAGGKQRHSRNWSEAVLLQSADTEDRSLGVEAQLLGKQSNWFASFTRYGGHVVLAEPESYLIDRGALRYNRDFPAGLSFRGSLSWQSAAKAGLPSSEQFQVGGDGSVRGYPVGLYTGDSGYAVDLELHHPLATALDGKGFGAKGFFFVDCGRVKPYRPPNSSLAEYEALTGVGWGLNADIGKSVHARLTLGYGLTQLTSESHSYEVTMQCSADLF
jgi:hemolysin activation/secretion protein